VIKHNVHTSVALGREPDWTEQYEVAADIVTLIIGCSYRATTGHCTATLILEASKDLDQESNDYAFADTISCYFRYMPYPPLDNHTRERLHACVCSKTIPVDNNHEGQVK